MLLFSFGLNYLGYSQKADFVKDPILREKIYKYLYVHRELIVEDSLGNRLNNEDDKYIGIFAWDVKTDSVVDNKNIPGIYGCKLASLAEKPYMYINYGDKIKFIKIDSSDISFKRTMRTVFHFIQKHENLYTFEEKLKVIKSISDIYFQNIYLSGWKW